MTERHPHSAGPEADASELHVAELLSAAAAAPDIEASSRLLLGEIGVLTGAARLALVTSGDDDAPPILAATQAPTERIVRSPGNANGRGRTPQRVDPPALVAGAASAAPWYSIPLGADAGSILVGAPAPHADWSRAAAIARLAGPIIARVVAFDRRVHEATADLAEQNARLVWQSQEIERANRL